MGALGILLVCSGGYLIYTGMTSLDPVKVLQAFAQNPAGIGVALAGAKAAATATSPSGETPDNNREESGGSFGDNNVGTSTTYSQQYQSYAESLFGRYLWSPSEMTPLVKLWGRESSWNVTAKNPSSGAYGIPQALPASKMASAGADYLTNYQTQIKWGLGYISSRYGTPTKAWAHEQSAGWY